jgi:hypothetical protein
MMERLIKSRMMSWADYVARVVGVTYRVLVGNPAEKRPLGRTRRGWGIVLECFLKK